MTGAGLTNAVPSSPTVTRITDGTRYYEDEDGDDAEETDQDTISRLYITDTTNFIAAESDGDELDVSTSTGMMTATHDKGTVTVAAIYDDETDALYVVYAADELSGATDKSDIVYLADRASTRSGTDTYSGDLYFMNDMSLSEEVDIDEDSDSRDQGFYVYDLSDDVYTLEVDTGNEVDVTDGLVDDDADGYAAFVVFTEGRNNTVASVTAPNPARGAAGGLAAPAGVLVAHVVPAEGSLHRDPAGQALGDGGRRHGNIHHEGGQDRTQGEGAGHDQVKDED